MMNRHDPNDALENYFLSLPSVSDDDAMLARIYRSSGRRRQKLISAGSGFVVGATLAVGLLLWATHPSMKNSNDTASAIARYQMIHSGLVDRYEGRSERAR